jgi:hypothetical protein
MAHEQNQTLSVRMYHTSCVYCCYSLAVVISITLKPETNLFEIMVTINSFIAAHSFIVVAFMIALIIEPKKNKAKYDASITQLYPVSYIVEKTTVVDLSKEDSVELVTVY